MMREKVQMDLMDPTGVTLSGFLHMPEEANALVLFVHAASKNQIDSRDIQLSHELNRRNIATLFIGLLSPLENVIKENERNVPLLSDRLVQVTIWVMQHELLMALPVGYFGEGTGAACCLQAAAVMNGHIRSLVSLSGHPELARQALPKVTASVQLIAGSEDKQTVYLNQIAYEQLRSKKKLVIINGASHSFEENGALEKVSRLTADWMEEHLIWLAQGQPSTQGRINL